MRTISPDGLAGLASQLFKKVSAPLLRVPLALLVCLGLASVGFAQNSNSGEIRGVVTDPTGAAIPGVAVTILNTQTGVSRSLTTNEAGVYDAVAILPGSYQVTFNKEGFAKLVRSGINLTANAITIDTQLKVGTSQQEVQVNAETPLLQTESGAQSTTLESKNMQQLPNVGQDWGNFTRLLPGAAGSGTGQPLPRRGCARRGPPRPTASAVSATS